MDAQPQRKKFVNYYENAIQKLIAFGISENQIERLRDFGLMAKDSVTEFHEGRSELADLRRAFGDPTRQRDLRRILLRRDGFENLSGLNAVLGHSGANKIFAMIASIVRRVVRNPSETCFSARRNK